MNNLENNPHILIYTDGSCLGNPGPGGYAAILCRIDTAGVEAKRLRIKGHAAEKTTNVRMEMTAVAAALERLQPDEAHPIVVRSDNSMISDGMNKWIAGWRERGWRKSGGGTVENRDLWERIVAASHGKSISWEWVKGHAGNPLNEEADLAARQQAKIAQTKVADILFPG